MRWILVLLLALFATPAFGQGQWCSESDKQGQCGLTAVNAGFSAYTTDNATTQSQMINTTGCDRVDILWDPELGGAGTSTTASYYRCPWLGSFTATLGNCTLLGNLSSGANVSLNQSADYIVIGNVGNAGALKWEAEVRCIQGPGARMGTQSQGVDQPRLGMYNFDDSFTVTPVPAEDKFTLGVTPNAGSGDEITVNGTSVDSTGDFRNTSSILMTHIDGPAGGPDGIEASIQPGGVVLAHLDDLCPGPDEIVEWGAGGTPSCVPSSTGGGGTPGNPTALVGITPVNGTSTEYMRADGAPAIDPTVVQRRVASSCTAGNAIRVINEDGTVTCESAGGGGGSAYIDQLSESTDGRCTIIIVDTINDRQLLRCDGYLHDDAGDLDYCTTGTTVGQGDYCDLTDGGAGTDDAIQGHFEGWQSLSTQQWEGITFYFHDSANPGDNAQGAEFNHFITKAALILKAMQDDLGGAVGQDSFGAEPTLRVVGGMRQVNLFHDDGVRISDKYEPDVCLDSADPSLDPNAFSASHDIGCVGSGIDFAGLGDISFYSNSNPDDDACVTNCSGGATTIVHTDRQGGDATVTQNDPQVVITNTRSGTEEGSIGIMGGGTWCADDDGDADNADGQVNTGRNCYSVAYRYAGACSITTSQGCVNVGVQDSCPGGETCNASNTVFHLDRPYEGTSGTVTDWAFYNGYLVHIDVDDSEIHDGRWFVQQGTGRFWAGLPTGPGDRNLPMSFIRFSGKHLDVSQIVDNTGPTHPNDTSQLAFSNDAQTAMGIRADVNILLPRWTRPPTLPGTKTQQKASRELIRGGAGAHLKCLTNGCRLVDAVITNMNIHRAIMIGNRSGYHFLDTMAGDDFSQGAWFPNGVRGATLWFNREHDDPVDNVDWIEIGAPCAGGTECDDFGQSRTVPDMGLRIVGPTINFGDNTATVARTFLDNDLVNARIDLNVKIRGADEVLDIVDSSSVSMSGVVDTEEIGDNVWAGGVMPTLVERGALAVDGDLYIDNWADFSPAFTTKATPAPTDKLLVFDGEMPGPSEAAECLQGSENGGVTTTGNPCTPWLRDATPAEEVYPAGPSDRVIVGHDGSGGSPGVVIDPQTKRMEFAPDWASVFAPPSTVVRQCWEPKSNNGNSQPFCGPLAAGSLTPINMDDNGLLWGDGPNAYGAPPEGGHGLLAADSIPPNLVRSIDTLTESGEANGVWFDYSDFGKLFFEGAVANAFQAMVTIDTEPLADETFTIPNGSGSDTFAMLDLSQSMSKKIFTDGLAIPIDEAILAQGEITLDETEDQLVVGTAGGVAVFDPEECDLEITLEDPTDAEDATIGFTNRPITVQEMRAVLIGSATPSVTWTVRHGTDRSLVGNEVVTGGTVTTSTTTGSDVVTFNDANIDADSFVWLETTAQSGTVDELFVAVCYRYGRL